MNLKIRAHGIGSLLMRIVSVAAAVMLLVGASHAVFAQGYNEKAVADFYSGKTIRIIVGFAPGASFDLTARALSRHMSQYIPGNPTIIVENVAGAGTMLAMNRVYNQLPKDGTIIGSVIGDVVKHQLFGNPAAQFDINKMRILSGPAEISHMLIVTKDSGVSSIQEIMGPHPAKKVKIGATGKGTSVAASAFLAKMAVGLNYDIVSSYEGFAKIKLAMEQGEVNATFNNIHELMGLYKDKIDSGEWKIIAQSTEKPHPRAPNVPVIADLASTPELRRLQILGAVLPMRFAFMYVLAPGVPDDRATALEQAMDKTLQDRAFVEDMTKTGLVVDPIPAKDMRSMVSTVMNMDAATKEKLAPLIQ